MDGSTYRQVPWKGAPLTHIEASSCEVQTLREMLHRTQTALLGRSKK